MLFFKAGGSGASGQFDEFVRAVVDMSDLLDQNRAILSDTPASPPCNSLMGASRSLGRTICTGPCIASFIRSARQSLPRHDRLRTRFAYKSLKGRYAVIETKDLTKTYGQLHAINHLDIKLERGDVFGFIGPQRRRQDDHDAHPGYALEPDLRRSVRLRLLDLYQAEGNPPRDRLHA